MRMAVSGIGVTPIMAMAQAAQRAGVDWRMLYGGRSRHTMAFISDSERAQGNVMMLCVSRALTPTLTLDL